MIKVIVVGGHWSIWVTVFQFVSSEFSSIYLKIAMTWWYGVILLHWWWVRVHYDPSSETTDNVVVWIFFFNSVQYQVDISGYFLHIVSRVSKSSWCFEKPWLLSAAQGAVVPQWNLAFEIHFKCSLFHTKSPQPTIKAMLAYLMLIPDSQPPL